jgi:hypothetical protein
VVSVSPAGLAAGNITFRGVAVDCSSGQAPARVAVFDGTAPDAPYVADASIDTTVNLSTVCPGRSGSAQVGFTLIMDSRILADGPHLLSFVAEYPNGTSAVGTTDLVLANIQPREEQESDSGSSE